MLVGREEELSTLTLLEKSKKAEMLVLYGRRRVGKSALVQHFCGGKRALLFEAIEGASTKVQIDHFTEQLRAQIKDPLLEGVRFADWNAVFGYITHYLQRQDKKVVLFFDEFQWQAAGHTKLVGLLKYVWDNHWKKHAPLLILCGSIGSFMVRNVLRSKALYGRVTAEMHLRGLSLSGVRAILRNMRSNDEVLRYLLVFGGIPKYLEEIDLRKSFAQNMNRLCFSRDGVMVSEIDRIFASQFREAATYKRIVGELLAGPMRLKDIADALGMHSSGGLKEYLNNLILADMIDVSVPLGRSENSKNRCYRVSDEFLCFYSKFMARTGF
jgi:AAA+ ATPase superfamily predicted ATPase